MAWMIFGAVLWLIVGCATLLTVSQRRGHDLRVVMDSDGFCMVYRDGQEIGAARSPGVIVDAPGAMR